MGRLIDDKKLMEAFTLQQTKIPYEVFYRVIKATVDSQPTAYDVDSVVEQLEKKIDVAKKQIVDPPHDELDKAANDVSNDFIDAYMDAIEVVSKGGVENG